MKIKLLNMLVFCCTCILIMCSCGHEEEFTIEGKWKNVGNYTFGQVQEGAIIAFDGTKCNLYSPSDTYAFYKNGDSYTLECTSLAFSETLTFDVEVIDADHINLYRGNNVLELQRPGSDSSNKKRALQFVMYANVGDENGIGNRPSEGEVVTFDKDDVLLDGMDVKKAEIGTLENSQTGVEENIVNITFTSKGADKLAQITAAAFPSEELIAVISNGKLISAPRVTSEITDGKCVIYFPSADVEEMQNLVDALS